MTIEAYFGLEISNPPRTSGRGPPDYVEGGRAISCDAGYRNNPNAALETHQGVIDLIILGYCDTGNPYRHKCDKHSMNQLPSRNAVSKSAYLIVFHTILLL